MKLTGKEPWLSKMIKDGALIWMREWGDNGGWWPIVFVEMDCGLIKIDVCGKTQNMDLGDCAQLRIENDTIIDNEDIWQLTDTNYYKAA